MRSYPFMLIACFGGAAALSPPAGYPDIPGYLRTPGDCGYPVCQSIKPAWPGSNMTAFAAACNATGGCEGFNSNGYLKQCLPPRCPAAAAGLEPAAACALYTKIGAPADARSRPSSSG